jgi:hypothetical protein
MNLLEMVWLFDFTCVLLHTRHSREETCERSFVSFVSFEDIDVSVQNMMSIFIVRLSGDSPGEPLLRFMKVTYSSMERTTRLCQCATHLVEVRPWRHVHPLVLAAWHPSGSADGPSPPPPSAVVFQVTAFVPFSNADITYTRGSHYILLGRYTRLVTSDSDRTYPIRRHIRSRTDHNPFNLLRWIKTSWRPLWTFDEEEKGRQCTLSGLETGS